MSSYHTSFTYLGKNSYKDFHWIIVHFSPDDGETDSYLSQDQIYTDSHNGSKRILYGTRWNATPVTKITVIKSNGEGFSLQDCRNAFRWLTGNPQANWLDLYVGDQLKYSFLGTVQDVKQQKLDARTVGMNIYFESITPWAYSQKQYVSVPFGQNLSVSQDGVLHKSNGISFVVDDNGVLLNNTTSVNGNFKVLDNGTTYIDPSVTININNQSDDLYSYVYPDITFTNGTCDSVSIINKTLDETTVITNVSKNEIITLSSGQFITSDKPSKIFGDTFNFVWPKLSPGNNEFVIDGTGSGHIEFVYRSPMKVGDCAIDVDIEGDNICCGDSYNDNPVSGPVAWDDITNKPTTVKGYGITDAYTILEVDKKLESIDVNADMNIDENELNDMLAGIFDE